MNPLRCTISWRIGLGIDLLLLAVVVVSIALQIASHHVDWLGQLLRTSSMSLMDCFILLAIGAIPLVVLGSGVLPPSHDSE